VLGEAIGNFKIVRRLGRGGMGEVWLAEQQQLGTKVAVKVLLEVLPAGSEDVQRFFNEARAASVIQHAGITKIFDSGLLANGRAYLVMEFLDGEALANRIARGPMSLAQLAEIGRQIASVLEATHAAGIVHRDLKPENVFLIPDLEMPGGERVKVLDFGVAKLSGLLGAGSPKTFGTLGTPSYMAPEQWGDASQVDGRVDLYALGCLTFEMACGRPPFVCRTVAEACAKHLNDVPPLASSLVANVPPELDRLIAQLLEKEPDARPRSMREVARAFAQLGGRIGTESGIPSGSQLDQTSSGVTLETSPTGPRARQRPRRRTLVLLVGAAAITGTAIAMVGSRSAPRDAIEKPRPIVTAMLPAGAARAAVADAAVTAARSELATAVASTIAERAPDAGAARPVAAVAARHADPTIDRGAVQAVLDVHHAALAACNKHRAVTANLTVVFSIGPDGRATKLSAGGPDSIVTCVLGVVGALAFPKPIGGTVDLAMPLALEPPALPDHLSQEQVANGLLTAEKDLDACMRASHVQAKTILKTSIAAGGQVTSTTVVGALAGSPFETCAADALRSIEFPPAHKALTISFPVTPE
jgi:hypothetical protein